MEKHFNGTTQGESIGNGKVLNCYHASYQAIEWSGKAHMYGMLTMLQQEDESQIFEYGGIVYKNLVLDMVTL